MSSKSAPGVRRRFVFCPSDQVKSLTSIVAQISNRNGDATKDIIFVKPWAPHSKPSLEPATTSALCPMCLLKSSCDFRQAKKFEELFANEFGLLLFRTSGARTSRRAVPRWRTFR